MALTREQKEAQLKNLTEQMKAAKSVMFTQYIGLNVTQVGKLRSELKKGKAVMQVGKKTLIRKAAKELSMPEVPENAFDGPIACVFSTNDPVIGASITLKFGKENPQVKLVGGYFEGKYMDAKQAMEFAKIPSREVLLATFIGMVQSPLRSFASICASPLSGFARALSEVAKKKESAAPAAAAPAAPAAESAVAEPTPAN